MCMQTGIRKTSRLSRPYINLFMFRLYREQATCPANQHKVLKAPKKCVATHTHTHTHIYIYIYIYVYERPVATLRIIHTNSQQNTRFRREADENCALLGYYAASRGNFLPTFRDNLSVPSSGVKS